MSLISIYCQSFERECLTASEQSAVEYAVLQCAYVQYGDGFPMDARILNGGFPGISCDILLSYDEGFLNVGNPMQKISDIQSLLEKALSDYLPLAKVCRVQGKVSIKSITSGKIRQKPSEETPASSASSFSAQNADAGREASSFSSKNAGTGREASSFSSKNAETGRGAAAYSSQNADADREEELGENYHERAGQYKAEPPKFTFDQVILPAETEERLVEAIAVLQYRDILFKQWKLGSLMSPSVLLNLYGDSGTGKTMAAEAIASRLGKPIIRGTYADIENKYLGESAKNLKAIFLAAQEQDAVLFIDEADSLLSARMSNTSESTTAQAANSLRSQLLISLENFDGVVIFATNLIENYDKAFLTRLLCVELKRPDEEARKRIWEIHLYGTKDNRLAIPLSSEVDLDTLSQFDFCGRDIRNAVKYACISTVAAGKNIVDQETIFKACCRIREELESVKSAAAQHWDRDMQVQEMSEEERLATAKQYLEAKARKKEAEKI